MGRSVCAAQAFIRTAGAEVKFQIDIEQQSLSAALKQFALQTGLQVARLSDESAGDPTVGPLEGTYTTAEALHMLLRPTPFTYKIVDPRTIAVIHTADAAAKRGKHDAADVARGNLANSSNANRSAESEAGGPQSSQAIVATGSSLRDSGEPDPEVIVTGSRIQQQSGMTTPTPVTMMSARELQNLSPGNLIDSMSLMPQFLMNSTPTNAFSFATNAGQSFLNLRGLGPNRTLVLLDGRRVAPSSRLGSTDIGVFPTALIKRVEVVTGGASAAYGSDAVGGVANFILDTGFDGLAARAEGGITDRGDNGNASFSIAGGTSLTERLHVIGSFEYLRANRIETYAGRDWFQGWGHVTNPEWTRTGAGPALLTLPHVSSTRYTFGGLINQPGSALDRLAFQPDGTARPFVLGPVAAVNGGTQSQSGGIGDNYEADRTGDGSLYPGLQRGSAFGYMSYDVSDDTRLYMQALYGVNHIDFVNVGAVQFGQWQATIYQDNAYLPESLRQIMREEGLPSFGFSRMASSADLAQARDIVSNHTYSLTTGFRSELGSWRVAGYYQFGQNQGDTSLKDFVRTDRLSMALDAVVSPVSGQVVCRVRLFNPQSGCIPINLFGAGRASAEAIDYVLDDKHGYVTVGQHFAEVSADGAVAPGLGAGPVLLAVGASFREDRFSQDATPSDSFIVTPDNDPARGIQGIPAAFIGSFVHQFSSFPDLHGAYTVKEAFAETRIPLYADEQEVRQASMSLAARYARYSGSGGIWAWKAGLEGSLTRDLRLRGTLSRDTRAANLSERFDLQNRGYNVRDPMFGNGVYALSATGAGNPEVDPEKADTVTFGVVYQPAWLDGLSMSLDWYSISIHDAIGQLGPQTIIDDCFAGAVQLCGLITRDPVTREIVFVRNTFLNVAEAKAVGADFEASFSRNVHIFGGAESLNARWVASWLRENSATMAGAPKVDMAGQTGGDAAYPDVQLTAALSYRRGPFELYLQGHYIDRGSLDATLVQGVDIDDNTVASVFYTDLLVSYERPLAPSGSWEMYAHIQNLFDRDPPRAPGYSDFNGATDTNENLFDVLGRRFTLGVRLHF